MFRRFSIRAFVRRVWFTNTQSTITSCCNQETISIGHRTGIIGDLRNSSATDGHGDDIGTIISGIQNSLGNIRSSTIAPGLHHFDRHNFCPRAYSRNACVIIGFRGSNSCTVRTVAVVIHGIPIIVDEVPPVLVIFKAITVVIHVGKAVDFGHIDPHLVL